MQASAWGSVWLAHLILHFVEGFPESRRHSQLGVRFCVVWMCLVSGSCWGQQEQLWDRPPGEGRKPHCPEMAARFAPSFLPEI